MFVTSRANAAHWQSAFLSILPAVERQIQRALVHIQPHERQEAAQTILANAALAFARLVELDRTQLAYPEPLVRYGLKQYRAGRLVGSRTNSNDVGSKSCQKKHGCCAEPLETWKASLVEGRGMTPADIAALRIDFSDWFQSLSPRDQRLASELARGESTNAVAKMFRITAGRVSQLRRELYDSWQRFLGEPVLGCG
jgi:hypothetical protein